MKANPNGVKLPPVKPPSRQAVPAEQTELQWDEFLTGLDEFDQGALSIWHLGLASWGLSHMCVHHACVAYACRSAKQSRVF